MNNSFTGAEIDRSRGMIAPVLGPDEINRLHNNPPEPVVDEAEVAAKAAATQAAEDKRVADLIANATVWAKLHPIIETEEVAVAGVDWFNQLAKDWDKIEAKRVAERKPLREQLAAIQAKYVPWLTRIGICRDAIEKPLREYKLRADRARAARDAEAARAAADAQRRADQLAAQAEAGGPNVIAATILAHEATEEAKRAAQLAAAVPKRTQIRGDLGGRTHSLRTVWYANIVEIDKTFAHYKGRAEVKELLTRLASADARNPRLWKNPADRYIPGCHVYSEQE